MNTLLFLPTAGLLSNDITTVLAPFIRSVSNRKIAHPFGKLARKYVIKRWRSAGHYASIARAGFPTARLRAAHKNRVPRRREPGGTMSGFP